jgi:hypothetical protein
MKTEKLIFSDLPYVKLYQELERCGLRIFHISMFVIYKLRGTFNMIEYINRYFLLSKVYSSGGIVFLKKSILITVLIYLLTSKSLPCQLKLQFLIEYSKAPSAMIPVIVETFASLTDISSGGQR